MKLFHNKKVVDAYVLDEHLRPAELPSPGLGLEKFQPLQYTANTPQKLEDFYNSCAEKLTCLLAVTDEYTDPAVADPFVDAQIGHLTQLHQAEQIRHSEQCGRIRAAQQTRLETLEIRSAQLRIRETTLEQERAPLEGLSARHEITLFGRHISTGGLATFVFMLVDAALNFSFLQNILFENMFLLLLIVSSMSVLSDMTMNVLGTLVSRRDEYIAENRRFYRLACGIMFFFFLLSAVATLLIRLGSMNQTYGNVAADGTFAVGSYGLAEYSVQTLSAFVTACTGILSFVLSVDPAAHKVKRRRKLEAELSRIRNMLEHTTEELSALRRASDPAVCDAEMSATALKNIEALRTGLKLHVRKLMAERISKPEFTDHVFTTAQECGEALARQPVLYTLKAKH